MKRFAFVTAALFLLAGAATAQAQTTTESNPWFDTAPAATSDSYPTGWKVAPAANPTVSARPSTDYHGRPLKARPRKAARVEVADAPVYETGWSTAPGMALSLHQRPTTDYWGRPLKPTVRKAPTSLSAEPELQPQGAPVATVYRPQQ
ncbi:hypothetical protein MUN82_18575 [Hymenobacter aerilatus]|uniref:Uncharacterized protein n=1 Tax=Hymenobacter aerilatus TaxID=2932251 RepID=A0A8T9SS44_9BACT|nr:hypothetical protein [Hymenobacter aerilatus]UOR04932.1 hypothetical protein MUN82_18575 [Hymenobacter aerilatus]